jgi:hypothetical protein
MKGTHFNRPLEFKIEIQGEQWIQGQAIRGEFEIINHSPEKQDLKTFELGLAFGHLKKIKNKDSKAFEIDQKIPFPKEIAGKATLQFSWDFLLPKNAPISDKSSSYFLLYGDLSQPMSAGQLQTLIFPLPIYLSFVEIFENFFRFKKKEIKSKKGRIEVLFAPPITKDFIGLESLLCSFLVKDQEIELIFHAELKKMAYVDGDMKIKIVGEKVELLLTNKQYLLYQNSLNQEVVIKALDEVLQKFKGKVLGAS